MIVDYKDILKAWDEQKPLGRKGGKSFWLAIKTAIEKQIPVKPRIETTKEVPITHNLGRLLYFYCPRCGKFLGGIYENDQKRGGGIHPNMQGCHRCLQAIDFAEWRKHEDGDLVLED